MLADVRAISSAVCRRIPCGVVGEGLGGGEAGAGAHATAAARARADNTATAGVRMPVVCLTSQKVSPRTKGRAPRTPPCVRGAQGRGQAYAFTSSSPTDPWPLCSTTRSRVVLTEGKLTRL
ncbi:hypothetical protein GCM10009734_93710 [Nonomuraea bangladeshensis]